MVATMQMFFYDLANRVEAAVSKQLPGTVSRWEKRALRNMDAEGYRVADPRFDKPLLDDTKLVSDLYHMPEVGKVIIYDHKFPNASYMRNSKTMLISTSLLETLDREERKAIIGHEFGHRNRRSLMQAVRVALVVTGVLLATLVTSKFKKNITGFLQECTPEQSILRKGADKLADNAAIVPWGVGLLYAWAGYGMNWLMEIPEGTLQRGFELDADKQAAEKLRNPAALASALLKINQTIQEVRQQREPIPPTDPAMKDLEIPAPPRDPEPSAFTKFIDKSKETHPSIQKRVDILQRIAERQQQGAGVKTL